MMRFLAFLFLLVSGYSFGTERADDALQLLQRAAKAAASLSYSGTFVFQNEGHMEASKITHLNEGGQELERIEVLDGSPREIIRENNEVKCFLPESRLLVLERRNVQRGFPAVLPGGLGGITDFYAIRRGAPARVAGFDTQSIVAEPRDTYRFARQFWIDGTSGLLLKSGLRGDHGNFIESFAFTEVQIGGAITRDQLKARSSLSKGDWRIHDIRAVRQDGGSEWIFHAGIPGFRMVSELRRPARDEAPSSAHFIFSDGLAAISVFIEPLVAGHPLPQQGMFSMGAINVYRRVAENMNFVVMGDVPPLALKTLGDGIGRRNK